MKARREANRYDKIFKENLEAVTLALVEKVLDIAVAKAEKLQVDIPKTLERKPDQLLHITDRNGAQFVLHLEFQLADEADMAERMLEYWILLWRKYKLPLRQCVFFLSDRTPTMPTRIQQSAVQFQFPLVSLSQIDHHVFLDSDKPDEVVFAVLGHFGDEPPGQVAARIIERLSATSGSRLAFDKHLEQLRVLANLRTLKPFIEEIMQSIIKYINPEEDYLFRKGEEKGIERGIDAGVERGVEQEKHQVVARLLRKNTFTDEQIAEIASVPVALVEQMRRQNPAS